MGFFFSLAKVVISSDLRSIRWVYVTLPRYTPLSATETNEKDQSCDHGPVDDHGQEVNGDACV